MLQTTLLEQVEGREVLTLEMEIARMERRNEHEDDGDGVESE